MTGTILLIAWPVLWLACAILGFYKKTGAVIAVGGGLIASTALIAAIAVMSVSGTPDDPNAWKQRDQSSMAYVRLKYEVEERLKAPATADFASQLDSRIAHIGDQLYVISSYVDSQNSFGANVRTRFVGEVQQVEPDRWVIVSLTFDK